MTTDHIIAEIDAEIARLKQVRTLLSTSTTEDDHKPVRKARKLSAAARKKIAAAQKARWAKQRVSS